MPPNPPSDLCFEACMGHCSPPPNVKSGMKPCIPPEPPSSAQCGYHQKIALQPAVAATLCEIPRFLKHCVALHNYSLRLSQK